MPFQKVRLLDFDRISNRYHGEVEEPSADGTPVKRLVAVIGHPKWPFERVIRELTMAAHNLPKLARKHLSQ